MMWQLGRGGGCGVDEVVARLRAAGCVFAEDEAALLVGAADGSGVELERMLLRRVAGDPLEQILGWAEFAGLRIRVTPGVFVPRRRSELLVRCALSALSGMRGPTVLDLCCGTGAIGAAIAASRPDADVWAADLDPAATASARLNLRPEHVLEGDLFDALPHSLRARIDVIAVNAPYVPTEAIATMPPEARLFEASLALDGGRDGLDVQRRVIAGAAEWLAPGGTLMIETSERQAPQTATLFVAAGLHPFVERDDELDATVVIGRSEQVRPPGAAASGDGPRGASTQSR